MDREFKENRPELIILLCVYSNGRANLICPFFILTRGGFFRTTHEHMHADPNKHWNVCPQTPSFCHLYSLSLPLSLHLSAALAKLYKTCGVGEKCGVGGGRIVSFAVYCVTRKRVCVCVHALY